MIYYSGLEVFEVAVSMTTGTVICGASALSLIALVLNR